MDIQNENNSVFNIKLSKLFGMYQILNPGTVKYRGQNIYHIVTFFILLIMYLTSLILLLSGLYYWTVNLPISMDYIWKSVILYYATYKMWFVIRHSTDIWNCLSITRFDFTSISNRNKHRIQVRFRERLTWLTNTYAVIYFTSMVVYLTITMGFREHKSAVKNHDGSIGYYRQNIINLYFIVSEETYNTHYYMFYFIEMLYLALFNIIFIIFDIILATLCYGMCCQMKIISSAFKSLGHKTLRDHHSTIDYTVENEKLTPNDHSLIYDEIKTLIMHHQSVMKKYEDFLTLFRQIMLLQIFISSLSVIMLWFNFIMSFSDDDRFKTTDVVIKKMFCSIPSILFQIFMVCHLFDNIHDQKDSIITALYSSNWTEMDMKCKKMILLTMKLNNANYKQLQFTKTKIVNLEMFFKTMGNCYSIISVLVNCI